MILAFGAVALTLLAIEGGLRVAAHFRNQHSLGALEGLPERLTMGQPAKLREILRLAKNPRIVYELRPGLSVLLKGRPVTTDAHGYRVPGPERSTDPPSGYRIVGLGDSYMFGLGVGDQDCYLALLSSMLEASDYQSMDLPGVKRPHGIERPQLLDGRRPSGRSAIGEHRSGAGPFSIVNTAVPGYNTVMEVETLKEKELHPPPDLVIIELIGNDFELPNFIRKEAPVLSPEHCFLCDFVRRRLYQRRRLAAWQSQYDASLVHAPQDPMTGRFLSDPDLVPEKYADLVGLPAYEAAMKELGRLRDDHGFQVLVMSPSIWESTLQKEARRLSRRLGFHWLDTGGIFRRFLKARGIASSEIPRSPSAKPITTPLFWPTP